MGLKRELEWDLEGGGAQGNDGGGPPNNFSVVDDGEGCGHLLDTAKMIRTVLEFAVAEKFRPSSAVSGIENR